MTDNRVNKERQERYRRLQSLLNQKGVFTSDSFWRKWKSIENEYSSNYPNRNKVDLWQILTDFDHTLSDPQSEQCHGMVARRTPIDEFCSHVAILMDKEKSKAKYGDSKPRSFFWSHFHESMQSHGLEKWMIKQILNEAKCFLREHTNELFRLCKTHNLPILVISAGIENIIEEFLAKQGVLFDNVKIFANRMIFADELYENQLSMSQFSLSHLRIHKELSQSSLSLSLDSSQTKTQTPVSPKPAVSIDQRAAWQKEARRQRRVRQARAMKMDTENDDDDGSADDSDDSLSLDNSDDDADDEKNHSQISLIGPLIYSDNKDKIYEYCREYFDSHQIQSKPFALVMGDSLTDTLVIKELPFLKEHISIGFLCKDIEKKMKKYQDNFDIVLTRKNASMEWVYDLFLNMLGGWDEWERHLEIVHENDDEIKEENKNDDDPPLNGSIQSISVNDRFDLLRAYDVHDEIESSASAGSADELDDDDDDEDDRDDENGGGDSEEGHSFDSFIWEID